MNNSKLAVGSLIRSYIINVYTDEILYVVRIDLDNDLVYLISRDEYLVTATYSKMIDADSNNDISKRLTTLRTFLFSDEKFLKRLFI